MRRCSGFVTDITCVMATLSKREPNEKSDHPIHMGVRLHRNAARMGRIAQRVTEAK